MSTIDIAVRYTGKWQTCTLQGMTGSSAKNAKGAVIALGRQLYGKSFARVQQLFLANNHGALVWRIHTKRSPAYAISKETL